MAGKGYISVVAGKEFNFGELFAMVREYFANELSVDGFHDIVVQLTGVIQTFVSEIDPSDFKQSHAYEALAYATLATFFLREYAKFNDREYAEVQSELADAWSQLMMMLDAKGIEVTIPFPS
jgi:hypothetical protein